jgi:hypothetical protein
MLKRRKLSFLSLSLLLALLAAAVMPFSVLAQDGTPPPADPPAVEEVPPAEDLTVPEVLEQLPADTSLVVLDENGEVLPLTAEEAAAVVVSGDPIWCPTGVDPNPGVDGCTYAQASLSELITVLQTQTAGVFDYAGAGTIYIAADYDASTASSPDYGTDIFFSPDPESSFQIGLTDLVVQGGWGGAPGSSSNLSGINSLNFWYWRSTPLSLTLNNIILDGAGWNGDLPNGSGLSVDGNYGNVELNNVSVTNSNWDGASIYATGNVELNNVTVTHSDEEGVSIHNEGDVTIRNSDFSNNGDGLYVYAYGNVTLNGVTANGNHSTGADVGTTGGNMDITNSQFNSNGNTYSDSGTVNVWFGS